MSDDRPQNETVKSIDAKFDNIDNLYNALERLSSNLTDVARKKNAVDTLRYKQLF